MGVIRQWLCMMCLAASTLAAVQPNIVQPNVVLITLDTTRADRMGFLGSKRGLTPNLDRLARDSAVFTRAYAQAPLTSVSHATILTGTYPQFHQVLDFPMPLVKELPYAPDILHAQGYHTAAFIGSIALDSSSGAPGFNRGFDTYDAGYQHEGFANQTRYQTVERRGGEVVARALAWLTKNPKGPFLLWVHLYDAHDPYDPPEPYKTRYASEPYDGEIAYADSAVGQLLSELKKRGHYNDSVIAVMADHGESLGAHGEDTHGVFLYDETIHVPLMFKLPHGASAEKRIENRVELADVMPTILQAVGVEIPADVQGKSLLSLITPGNDGASEEWRDRPAYAEADYGNLAYGWSALQSLRTGKYLFIQAPRRELYDAGEDPKAEHNLAPASPAVADTLAGRVEAFRKTTTTKREAPTVIVDPATQEKLASLGYISSGGKVTKPDAPNHGADPKDEIETANGIRRVNSLFETGQLSDAVPMLQQLISKDPGIAILYSKLGGTYMKLHQYDKAVPVLRKAVELDPTSTTAQMDLGRSLLRTQDFNGAATVFETLLARIPALLDAHLFLKIAYSKADRVPETIKECRKVIELLPDHFGSHLTLGEFLAKSGDLAGAVPELQKAAELQPNRPRPHAALAQVYDQLGRKEDAERERAKAGSLAGNAPEE
jgi:arylsulfatase A-like enzyme/Flp pilus assembly protein TadD